MMGFRSFLLALLLISPGCGAIFTSSHVNVRLDSDPRGADVTIDGVQIGKTPIETSVSNRKDHLVQFQMSGEAPTTCVLTSSIGAGYVILDVLFTGLIGVLIDATTGGWKELDQQGCFVRLKPAHAPITSPDLVSMSVDP